MQKTPERLAHDRQVEQSLTPTGRYNDARFRRLLAMQGREHPGFIGYRAIPGAKQTEGEPYYAQRARVLGKK